METKSRLTPDQQEQLARILVREFRPLGVLLETAREEVATGKWDDHPAAWGMQSANDSPPSDD